MISRLLLIGALLAPLICHAGADRFAQERNPRSETECAAGETVIVVAKDAGVDPVIKSTTPEVHYLGYAGTPTITGSIVGSDLLLAANGLFGKDITWQLRIERA